MKAILTAVIAMLVSVGTAQTVVSNNVLTKRICYVKKDAKGSNNGENWQDALTELSTALDFAKAHQKEFTEKEPLQIWVAGSANYSYSPKVGDGITADKATFAMVKNVKIYGGFAGNETALLQRNWYANPTVLSGRVNNAGVAHIGRLITSEGAMGVATLDGFRLKYAAAPINGKKGVAIYVANGSPHFENCAITDNLFGSEALIYVKGTERERATPIFINLQVSDNTPKKEDIIGDNVDDNIDQPNNGADGLVMTPWAMENDQYADTQLINATFYNNGSNDLKVARSASPKIYNTVLLGNVNVQGNLKNIDVQYSMVNGALSGNGNIPVESPAGIFVSLSKDDKHYLRPKRSLINAGNGGLYRSKSDNDFDLAHMPRIMEETIDIGAYEFYKDYESICNEIPRPNIEPNYYGNSCDGGGVEVRLSNYTDYHKINERGATYKVYDIEGKEVRPYMEPLIESYSGRIHINQEGNFKLVVSYKGCEKESDWFQIYYSRGAGKPNSPSLKTYPATCDSNSWVEIQNYESKYRYELLKDNRVIKTIKDKKLDGLEQGSYELKVYNNNSDDCYSSNKFTIEGKKTLEAPIVESLPAECGKKGKGYITQFEQKWTYQLLLNGKVLRKLNSAEFTADAGTYQVVVRNADGCVASTTFDIGKAKEIPKKPEVRVDAPACGVSGKAIITNYDRNLTYRLNNGASTKLLGSAEISEAGEYTLWAENSDSCSSEKFHFTVAAAKEGAVAPVVRTTSATCGEIGKARIDNYNEKLTYQLVALSATGAAVKSSAINTANLSMTAGTYQVVVRNANGCVATSATFVIEEAKKIPQKPDVWVDAPACGVSGKAIIKNYDRNLTYKLNNGASTELLGSAEINEAGKYTLEVSNGTCSREVQFVVEAAKEGAVAPVVRTTSATCGEIGKARIDNYNEKLTYQLVALSATGAVVKSSPINGAAIAVAAGSYKVEVRNTNGCVATSTTFVIEEAKKIPQKPDVWVEAPACGVSGKAIIKNYDRNLTYKLNNGASTKLLGSAEINEAGEYTLLVYNGSCDSEEVHFTVAAAKENVTAPKVTTTSATCGEIGKARIDNYNEKLTYQLVALSATGAVVKSSAINTANLSMTAGTYQVVVRNTNGCVATSTTFVIEEAKKIPQKPDVWVDAPACGVSGKAIIKNYDRNLTYKLNNGASTELLGSAEINEAGKYTLLVNNGSCDSEEVHFTVAAAKENVTAPKVTTTSATCGEIGKAYIEDYDSNLRYRLVALSATGAVVKSSPINTANLSVAAGTYQVVVVRKANGCVATSTTFVIEEAKKIPALPKIDFITEAGCGIANDIRIRDYDKNFSYTLISKSGARKPLHSLHIEATEGTYQLEVSNGDCAVTTSEFHIGKEKVLPAKPELRVLPATCGGVTDVLIKNYDNSLNYKLSPAIAGNEILSNGVISATANNYVLIVSNGSCTSQSDPFEIKAQLLPPAEPTIKEEVAATCAAPSLVRISNYDPALQYKLSPAGEILQGGVISATVGRYIVIATNNNGCSANSSIFVINPQKEAPAQPKITVYNASCGTKGSAVIRNYRGDYTYSFTPEATITAGGVISATAGKYQLKVSNGTCEATAVSFEIEAERAIPAQPTVIVTAPDCGVAGSARISNYDPQLSYTVLPKIEGNVVLANGVISVTAGGSYNVVVSNGYCKKSSEPFVVQRANEIPATPIVVTTSATCGEIGKAYIANYDRRYTDKYVLTPSGRVHYDGTIIAGAGNYVLSVNNGSCKVSTAFTIEAEKAMPQTPAIVTTPATCGEAGSAKITNYDSNFTYTLLEGNKSTVLDNAIISVGEGVYRVSVTNAAGCQVISREFSIQAAKVISEKPVVITQAAICGEEGSAYVANYNPIYQYTVFPNGSVDANGNIKASKNIFTYVTAHYKGCSATSEGFTIQPKLNGVEQPEILLIPGGCGAVGFARITNFNPDYEYEVLPTGTITPDGRVMAPPTNTYYRVRAFHNGCAATSENFRLQPSTSEFEKPVLSVAKENCNMGTIAFVKNYNKEFTYTVHPFGGVTKDTGILVFPENSVTHTFSVTVTASNGVCQSTSEAVLIIPERSYQPRVAIVARTCDSEGAAYITNYNPAYRYVFTDPLLSVTDAGVILGAQPELVYAVAARTPDDCSSKETVFSIRNECENEVPCKIEIFNAVSANNDDANDFFYIKNIECYPSNKVYIFNGQGKVVFEQQNYDNSHRSFRGISNTEGAQLLPSGTYFYILKYTDKRGRETDERGYLYLKGRY